MTQPVISWAKCIASLFSFDRQQNQRQTNRETRISAAISSLEKQSSSFLAILRDPKHPKYRQQADPRVLAHIIQHSSRLNAEEFKSIHLDLLRAASEAHMIQKGDKYYEIVDTEQKQDSDLGIYLQCADHDAVSYRLCLKAVCGIHDESPAAFTYENIPESVAELESLKVLSEEKEKQDKELFSSLQKTTRTSMKHSALFII
eukprot:TRINITY_DN2220_c0_g1_i2.p1 TRINITY_DN2220_c0_g1~~TRINITY_DN2220_c0_g1_i2.p1  ORF type:complete len:202 (-),score=24.35 TRINITY_DN2220_c0_g1_i2:58-663(-)